MKPIKIVKENGAMITEALKAVNGKAESFTVTGAWKVFSLAEEAEKKLEQSGVTKKKRGGSVVIFRPVGPTARAYKYTAKSTRITITRKANGNWYLTSIEETHVYPLQGEFHTIQISQKAKDEIIRHALDGFVCVETSEQNAILVTA